jgi:hypothetical protein
MTADTIGLTFSNWFKKLGAHITAKKVQSRTKFELNSLSDRDLADIGLHRGLIGPTAHDAYTMELEKQMQRLGLGGRG